MPRHRLRVRVVDLVVLTLLAPLVAMFLAPHAIADDADVKDARPLKGYFEAEVERIASKPLLGIASAEEWKSRRPELQRQLREMLGLDPLPERTDLKAEVRGTVERPDFIVEKIVFQSMPGLYVTGNLYRPREVSGPLPAILYVCGHAQRRERWCHLRQ